MDSRSSCVVVTGFGPFRQHLVNSSWEAVKAFAEISRQELLNPKIYGGQTMVEVMKITMTSFRRSHAALLHSVRPTLQQATADPRPRQRLLDSHGKVRELSKLGLGSDMQVELRILQLPVDYREVKQRVTRIWEDLRPQFVVHVGVDPAAKAIFLEQCSKNRGYRDADIRGFRPECGVCLPDGPEVIASEVSMKAVSRRAAVQGVEVAFSRDAGRYVCDYAYYLSLHHGNGCAALIHLPPLSPWLPASLLGQALQVIIQEMLEEIEKTRAPNLVHRKLSLCSSSQGEPTGGLLL